MPDQPDQHEGGPIGSCRRQPQALRIGHRVVGPAVNQNEACADRRGDPQRRQGVEVPLEVRRRRVEQSSRGLAIGSLEDCARLRVETVGVGADEHAHEHRIVVDLPPNVFVRVRPGEPEPQDFGRGCVAPEAQHHPHPLAAPRVGGRQERRAGADARPDEDRLPITRGEGGNHRLDVLGSEPAPGEPGDRGHRDVEARPRQEPRNVLDTRVVLALRREPVNEHQRTAGAEPSVDIEIGARAGERGGPADGLIGRRG